MTPQTPDVDMDDPLAPTATKHLSDKKFSDFPIRSDLLQGIPFERCTEGEFYLFQARLPSFLLFALSSSSPPSSPSFAASFHFRILSPSQDSSCHSRRWRCSRSGQDWNRKDSWIPRSHSPVPRLPSLPPSSIPDLNPHSLPYSRARPSNRHCRRAVPTIPPSSVRDSDCYRRNLNGQGLEGPSC